MGLCDSSFGIIGMESKAVAISKRIDRELASKSTNKLIRKLLLLGPGESGKSTCVKQMKILHANGFTQTEIEERKCIVYSNTVRSMLELSQVVEVLNIRVENSASIMNDVTILKKHIDCGLEYICITYEVRDAIARLWNDPCIRMAYERRSNFHIMDSAKYFFESIERIAGDEYKPTNHDILCTRVPTTGVVRLIFTFKNIEFNVIDVGGQRSERRKWIHFFDDVNGIIFVAAISEYDQKLLEDDRTNRLIETLQLFANISNSRYFSNSAMILFLNKIDLFKEKMTRISLKETFPHYKGEMNFEDGVKYLKRKFTKVYKNKQKLYIHKTCAMDTDQLNQVFNSVIDTVLQENMSDSAII